MNEVRFIWDESKDASNRKKHGVSFDEAKSVFLDEFARLIADPDHSEREERFILLGMSKKLNVLTVCHCEMSLSTIRIISARRADKSEQSEYERYRHA